MTIDKWHLLKSYQHSMHQIHVQQFSSAIFSSYGIWNQKIYQCLTCVHDWTPEDWQRVMSLLCFIVSWPLCSNNVSQPCAPTMMRLSCSELILGTFVRHPTIGMATSFNRRSDKHLWDVVQRLLRKDSMGHHLFNKRLGEKIVVCSNIMMIFI